MRQNIYREKERESISKKITRETEKLDDELWKETLQQAARQYL